MNDLKLVLVLTANSTAHETNPLLFQQAWIGMYDDVKSWRWSISDSSFYQNGEAAFRYWWPGLPDNDGGKEDCAEIYRAGPWNDKYCGNQNKAVCSDLNGEEFNSRRTTYVSLFFSSMIIVTQE